MSDIYEVNLSEQGVRDADALINSFKLKMKDACEEVLGSVYVDVAQHIESDSWLNYKEAMRVAFQHKMMTGWKEEVLGQWAKGVRDAIFEEHKEEITNQIIVDLQNEVKKLNGWLEESRRFR